MSKCASKRCSDTSIPAATLGTGVYVEPYRWLGMWWVGKPKPSRWFAKRSGDSTTYYGCGCMLWLKWLTLAAREFFTARPRADFEPHKRGERTRRIFTDPRAQVAVMRDRLREREQAVAKAAATPKPEPVAKPRVVMLNKPGADDATAML